MADDSPAPGFPKENPGGLEGIRLSADTHRSRAVRVLLPVFLAVALFQASDVIRGMGSAAVAQALPEAPRFSRRGFGGGRMAYGTPQAGRRVSPGDVKSFSGIKH